MNPIYVPAQSLHDWRKLLASDKHWRENYSAMSIAMSWHDAVGFPAAIARVFTKAGLPFSELEPLLIIPEHRVPLPGGTRIGLQRKSAMRARRRAI